MGKEKDAQTRAHTHTHTQTLHAIVTWCSGFIEFKRNGKERRIVCLTITESGGNTMMGVRKQDIL